MGWLVVISTVFLQVFLFMITSGPNKLSLYLSFSLYLVTDIFRCLFFTTILAALKLWLCKKKKKLWSCGLLQYIELQSHEAENSIKLWFKYENFWLFQNNSLVGKTHTFHRFALIKHNSSNGFLIEHFSQCWIHSLVAFIEHTVLEIVVLGWLINHFSSFSEILSPTLLNYTPVRFP